MRGLLAQHSVGDDLIGPGPVGNGLGYMRQHHASVRPRPRPPPEGCCGFWPRHTDDGERGDDDDETGKNRCDNGVRTDAAPAGTWSRIRNRLTSQPTAPVSSNSAATPNSASPSPATSPALRALGTRADRLGHDHERSEISRAGPPIRCPLVTHPVDSASGAAFRRPGHSRARPSVFTPSSCAMAHAHLPRRPTCRPARQGPSPATGNLSHSAASGSVSCSVASWRILAEGLICGLGGCKIASRPG